MLIKAFKMAQNGNYTFWMYIVYLIVLSPNGTGYMWYISNTFGLILWLCLIEGNYKKMELEQHYLDQCVEKGKENDWKTKISSAVKNT